MMSRSWLTAVWVCLFLLLPVALSEQINRVDENKQSTDCTDNSDRRYMECRGPWSGRTVALFNTWMAPDTNPERRLSLLSPDGKKVIQVRGFRGVEDEWKAILDAVWKYA